MPEGDTVWHTAAMLRDGLAGKALTRCEVRVPAFATIDLSETTVDEVISRGKHLFIRAGGASIHSHLKMDGSWRVAGPDRRRWRDNDHRVRIILETTDVQAVGIELGMLEILDRRHDMSVVAHLGPDLLGDDWNPSVAAANLTAEADRPIAAALLDQRVMAGIGNVYCNELCFVSGHLPTSPVREVTDPVRLVSRAHDMLMANRWRWNRTTTGNRRLGQELWIYGRRGKPCRRCGTLIESDGGAERVSYWCPSCQK
ncbi:MAG: Fpg/Nei family DNA glycosylase [Mycobacteriaceae bacterium]|nr:Fpg/Nei family DNA glycosylase [Mycobacteriaceae bacterium]MBV9638465.1 Fpg/Nei family DNA glycosylase [Mycobacteriaceae bacterium]